MRAMIRFELVSIRARVPASYSDTQAAPLSVATPKGCFSPEIRLLPAGNPEPPAIVVADG